VGSNSNEKTKFDIIDGFEETRTGKSDSTPQEASLLR
jgi:hypothetical protein